METKFYKWVAPFSDTIDQVLMVQQGISCRVNDFDERQLIQFFDYEVSTEDMTPATKEEFIAVYTKVYGDLFRRILNI